MIFKRIYIENFGALHDFSLELSAGINTLNGNNEFGKSTLLEFIRRLFWGYPDRRSKLNPYPQLHDSGRYGGEISLILDSKQEIRLERYGQRGELRCFDAASGEELDASRWNAANICKCSENFFRSIYAITIDELIRLEDLESGEIRQMLYGSGLGIPAKRLPELDKELKKAHEELYRQRGECRLNRLQCARTEITDELAAAIANEKQLAELDKQYTALCVKRDETAALIKILDKESDSLKAALAKESEVQKKIGELAVFRAEIEALHRKIEVQDLPSEAVMNQLENELAGIAAAEALVSAKTAELESLNKQLAADAAALAVFLDPDTAEMITDETLKKAAALEEKVRSFESEKTVRKHQAKLLYVLSALMAAVIIILLCCGISAAVWGFAAVIVSAGAARCRNRVSDNGCTAEYEKCRSRISGTLALRTEYCSDRLPELNFRLDTFRKEQTHSRELEKDIAEAKSGIAGFFSRYSALTGGASDVPQIRKYLADVRRSAIAAAADRQRLAEKTANMEKLRSSLPENPSDESEKLNAAVAEIGVIREKRSKEFAEIAAEIGKLSNEMDHLTASDDSAAVGTRLSAAEEKIRDTVREYLVRRTAGELLDLAIRKFETDHQSSVLKYASGLFSCFTGGRYSAVRRQLSSEELFFKDEISKREKLFPELSRGSREQALLALRLALIARREENSEKIPVILDDVTVDFDVERTANAADALNEFAEGRQILVLSCRKIPVQAE